MWAERSLDVLLVFSSFIANLLRLSTGSAVEMYLLRRPTVDTSLAWLRK